MLKVTIEGKATSLNDLAMLLSRVVDTVHQIDDTVGLKALREAEPYKFSIGRVHVALRDTSDAKDSPDGPAFPVAPVASPNARSYISADVEFSAPVGGIDVGAPGGDRTVKTLPKKMKK